MNNEITLNTELDERQFASGQIGSRLLSGLDEARLCVQDYNDLQRRLEVSAWPNDFLESSWILWKYECVPLKQELNTALASGKGKSVTQFEHRTPSVSTSQNMFECKSVHLSSIDTDWSYLKRKLLYLEIPFQVSSSFPASSTTIYILLTIKYP